MNKTAIILRKEWTELLQQRGLVLSTLALPIFFSVLPALTLLGDGMENLPSASASDLPPAVLVNPALASLTLREQAQALVGQQMSLLFMLLPIILPSIIAAYSIVGEKTGRTLEPLLATPIRTWELLLGKGLASLLPSVGLTWLCAGAFVAEMALLATSPAVFAAVVSPGWLIAVVLYVPFLTAIAVGGMVAVSSRVNDTRTAQQYSAIGIVPFMILFLGQIFGLVVLSPLVALVGALVLALLAALMLWVATRIFQREAILTRWK